MYASVRLYRIDQARAREFGEIIQREFVPLVARARGFVSYYGIDGGAGKWMSVSIFETEEDARATNALAAQFVGDRLLPMIRKGPEISLGPVVAAASSESSG